MNGQLNALDLLFIVILSVSLFVGIFRGLTREVLSLLFLVAGLALAFFYCKQAGLLAGVWIKDRGLADLVGFLAILAVVVGSGALIIRLLGKHLVKGPIKSLDRLLGAAFGLIRGFLLSALVIYCFLVFPLNQEVLDHSLLAPMLSRGIAAGIRVLPPSLRARLKVIQIHDRQKDNRTSRTV